MLVLTRKADAGHQSVLVVAQEIEVTVLEVKGDQIRLGIQAPVSVTVHRKEIWEQVRKDAGAVKPMIWP